MRQQRLLVNRSYTVDTPLAGNLEGEQIDTVEQSIRNPFIKLILEYLLCDKRKCGDKGLNKNNHTA